LPFFVELGYNNSIVIAIARVALVQPKLKN